MRLAGHIRGTSEFGPRDVAGLAIWLDASDPATLFQDSAMTTPAGDSLPVGGWMDKSGNGRHVIQTLATKRPTLGTASLNGRSAVRGDGVDDRMTSTGWSLTQPNTVFVVGRFDAVVASAVLIDGAASPGRHLVFASGSPIRIVMNAGTSFGTTFDADTAAHMLAAQFNGGASLCRADRTQVGSGNVGADPLNGLSIFGSYFATCFAVSLSEILVFNRVLTEAQIRRIENYVRRKWGTP